MSRRGIPSGLSLGLLDKALGTLGAEELLPCFEAVLDRALAGMTAAERSAFAAHVVDISFAKLLQGLSPEERSSLFDAMLAAALGQIGWDKGEGSGEQR